MRVKAGDNTTDWLPLIALRAGGVNGGRTWHPPVVGEQRTVLAPGGDLAQAVVLLGLYSDAMPQGSEQANCDRTDWDEENYFEWLRGVLTVYCTESINLSTPNTSLHMEGSTVTITGGGAVLTIGPGRVTSNGHRCARREPCASQAHRRACRCGPYGGASSMMDRTYRPGHQRITSTPAPKRGRHSHHPHWLARDAP